MNKKIYISLIAGCLLSVVSFYFALRNVPFKELVLYFKSINYIWIIPSLLMMVLSYFLRAWRWQVILHHISKLPFFAAFHPMMISFMINNILPGRIGEFARPAILKKQNKISYTSGLTTLAVERLFDMIILIILFVWVLSGVEIDPNHSIQFNDYQLNKSVLDMIARGMAVFCAVLAAGICLVSFSGIRKIIVKIIMKLPLLFPFFNDSQKEKVYTFCCKPLLSFIENIASGVSLINNPLGILTCTGLSIVIWTVQALSLYLFTFGCPGVSLTFCETTMVFIIICFFIALPSVPGFWGLWEAGGVFAMSLFGISQQNAIGFSLITHAITFFMVLVIGTISAAIIGVNIFKVSFNEEQLFDKRYSI
ncbi:MAG: lysylphosphatidylglycerol synthase transmembrane domain-containing protein [Desulfobacteraceae bacterium]|jgi:uncharacterized protein (TIRG00374 family)|nr:lysylphosphatidylglycerol synthase transmembrane domain-containing protein [Desulfobacteraceae bacterium]